MDADTLKRKQSVLKENYRDQPQTALHTMRATGQVHQDQLCIELSVHGGNIAAGLHPATGGDGTQACSGDMLLEALVGCAGVTLAAVATAMNITVQSGTITAEGDLDFRGTLGVSKDAPVGFRELRLIFNLTTTADSDDVAKLISLTEKYCVIYQTLSQPNSIKTVSGMVP